MLVALLVRLAAATSTVNVDEAFTYFVSRSSVPQIVASSRTDGHPPGFYLLLAPVAHSTHRAYLLRLPSLLCGVLSIGLVYLIGCRLSGRGAGLGAAALTALSYNSWLAEAQIRMYGCFTLLALAVLWGCLREQAEIPGWMAPACLLAPLFHFFGLGAVALAVLTALLTRNRRLALYGLAGLISGISWIAYAASGKVSHVVPRPSPPAENLFRSLLDWPAYIAGIPAALGWAPAMVVNWLIPLVGLLIWIAVGFGVVESIQKVGIGAWVAGAYFAGPLLVFFLVAALRGQKWLQHRLYVPFAPVMFVFLTVGLLRWKGKEVLGLLLLCNLVTAVLFPFRPALWNQNWGPVVEFVTAHQQPGDTIVFHHPYTMIAFNFYYLEGRPVVDFSVPGNLNVVLPESRPAVEQMGVMPGNLGPDLDASLGRRVFLVLSQESGGAVREWFGQRFGMVGGVEVPSIQAWGRNSVFLLERWPQQK